MRNQYNIVNHTILPLIYKIIGPHNHVAYLLKQPITKSLFMFNALANIQQKVSQDIQKTQSKYHSWLIQHIKNIEKISQCHLTHILANDSILNKQYQKFIQTLSKIQAGRKQIKFIKPEPQKKNQIKPEVIGELSVCFIDAEGYSPDYNLIGVTHISPTSTKVPVLFVNNLLGVCRIDYKNDKQPEGAYLKSLDKVKYFPNQTYIFPSHIALYDDLLFSKAIIDSETSSMRPSTLLNQRIALFEKNYKNSLESLIPTTIIEEKFMNPFLSPQKYSKVLNLPTKDKTKCFSLLKAMRKQWKAQL